MSLWSSIFQTLKEFYQQNKDIIDNLISGGLPTIVLAFFPFAWWLKWRHRQRKIPPDLFAFEAINPQSDNLKERILGGKDDDPLADRNIKYQQRKHDLHVTTKLRELLEEHRWVLILGKSGLGKTREATEIAEFLNQEGWTVLFLKSNQWLDIPARMPKEISTDRKLLFFIDDLNQKMYRSHHEISPEAEKSPVERFNVPLQERLLDTLERYEQLCGKVEIKVIATARNEQVADLPGEYSPWDKLEWDKYRKLWDKFEVYHLPEPEDDAIVDTLAAIVQEAKIDADVNDYAKIARRNDRTFRNVVENLRTVRSSNSRLKLATYAGKLGGTWIKRYQKAIKRYPHSSYIYDAVDLLQQYGITVERFTVEPTARILANSVIKNKSRSKKQSQLNSIFINIFLIPKKLWNNYKIRQAIAYLIDAENILYPRDGQIEAKEKKVEGGEYVQLFLRLVLKLADLKREGILDSLFNFGWYLQEAKFYKQAIISYDKAVEIKPDYHQAWYNRGIALRHLGRSQEAITSYDKAVEIKPDYHEAWYNRGNALDNLGGSQEAIASYDKAVEIKPDDHEAWYNRGIALRQLKQ